MVNGGQNLVGQVPGWRRLYTCLLVAVIAAIFAWQFTKVENGFFKVAGWSSIALPSTTVVMLVDQFVLPRVLRLRRPVEPIPSWSDAATANWPGIIAVLAGVLFGAWGLILFPGQTSAPNLGLVAPEAWILAGVLYLALAAAAARTTGAAVILGFSRNASRFSPVESVAGPSESESAPQ
jgi:cytosine/uracil/thiamine/allantoin permease